MGNAAGGLVIAAWVIQTTKHCGYVGNVAPVAGCNRDDDHPSMNTTFENTPPLLGPVGVDVACHVDVGASQDQTFSVATSGLRVRQRAVAFGAPPGEDRDPVNCL